MARDCFATIPIPGNQLHYVCEYATQVVRNFVLCGMSVMSSERDGEVVTSRLQAVGNAPLYAKR